MSPSDHLLLFAAIFFSGIVLVLVNSFRNRAKIRRALEEPNLEPPTLNTRIPMSRAKRLAVSLFFLGSGVYGFIFVELGTGFKIGVVVLGILGASILVLMVLGKAAAGWLDISTTGISFGDGTNSLSLPWDFIKSWRVGDVALNSAIFITLHDPETGIIMPPDADAKFRAKTRATVERNLKGLDAHIILQITIYETSPEAIVAAMRKYAPMEIAQANE